MDADVKKLSGGERRRVALCKLLLRTRLLLLDEPTNHLDADTVEWLEHHLKEYHGTVILITHDRYFLDNVVGWMLEIERGAARPYKATTRDTSSRSRSDARARQARRAAREDPRARARVDPQDAQARTARPSARMTRYKELVEQKAEEALEAIELRIPPGPRLGDKVIAFETSRRASASAS
jgi:ATPase subunit of ABC transporter with duplicated ATPase domains